MNPARNTYEHLITVGRAYPQLQKHFSEFYERAREIASERRPPLAGITFHREENPNQFAAYCYGRTIEFKFSIMAPENAGPKGLVTALELDNYKDKKVIKELGKFEFNHIGVLNMESPEDIEDQMEIGYSFGSWYLLCRCFEVALQP